MAAYPLDLHGWLGRFVSTFVHPPLQVFYLLVGVGIEPEVASHNSSMRFSERIFVKTSENLTDVIQPGVDPG